MAIWNVQTTTTDENGKQEHLGQVQTEIPDAGRAQELAERYFGEDITVTRESHLVWNSHGQVQRKED